MYCVKSLVPKLTKSNPTFINSSISTAAAGISTIIPKSMSLCGINPTDSQISLACFNSSGWFASGIIIPMFVYPWSWSFLIALNSAFSIPTCSNSLLIPLHPSIGFGSSGSFSPPSNVLNSSVGESSVLYHTGFG